MVSEGAGLVGLRLWLVVSFRVVVGSSRHFAGFRSGVE